MQLVIHRGAHQVGGSCVELAHGDTTILIDLGFPLDSDLSDDPKLHLPQPLFDNLKDGVKKVDAVILSHAHLDHYGLAGMLPRNIPVYCGKASAELMAITGKTSPEKIKPLKLKTFTAWKIFHIGPSGSGHKIKLLNQLMFGAINAMTAEMMAIAEKIGISPCQLFEIITASQAGTVSNLFKELGSRIAMGDYSDPTFTVDLLVKDIKLAVSMAKEKNAPPILARTVELINEISRVQGLGAKDTAIMWTSYKGIWDGKRDS